MGETTELDASEAAYWPQWRCYCAWICAIAVPANSLIFKDPAMGDAHEQAMSELSKQSSQEAAHQGISPCNELCEIT